MGKVASRRDGIRRVLERDGYVSLSSLSEEFGVAPVTIHRDLDHLEEEGVLERVRGGARRIRSTRPIATEFSGRQAQMREQKERIARRAIEAIPDGATIFMDSSTTVLAMAPFLEQEPGRGLTIVTNSPMLATGLKAPLIHLIVLPGEVNQSMRAVTGRWTVEFIEQLSFNVAFVSAAGVTESGGLMTTQRELAEVAKAALPRSQQRIALLDSSKFGVSALLTAAPMEQIDLLITDSGLSNEEAAIYRAAGFELERVEMERIEESRE